jgi:hypothetical protein
VEGSSVARRRSSRAEEEKPPGEKKEPSEKRPSEEAAPEEEKKVEREPREAEAEKPAEVEEREGPVALATRRLARELGWIQSRSPGAGAETWFAEREGKMRRVRRSREGDHRKAAELPDFSSP